MRYIRENIIGRDEQDDYDKAALKEIERLLPNYCGGI